MANEGIYPFSHFHLNLIRWIIEKSVMRIKYEIESFLGIFFVKGVICLQCLQNSTYNHLINL